MDEGFLHYSLDPKGDNSGYVPTNVTTVNDCQRAHVNPDLDSMTDEKYSYELTIKWEYTS